jgi:hypothetical protein
MGGGARERKQTEKGKTYAESMSAKKTRRAPVDMKGLISKMTKTSIGVPTQRSIEGMEIEVPRAPKKFEMRAATFGAPDAEMDTLSAQLSKSGIGGRKRKTRRRKTRRIH